MLGEVQMQKRLTAAFAAVLLAAGAGVSNANPFWAGPHASTPIAEGSWYAGIGGSAGVLRRPSWRRVGSLLFPNNSFGPPAPNLKVDMFAGGPTLSLGYVLPSGTLPPWAGRRLRLEVSGSIIHGAGSDRFNGVASNNNNPAVVLNIDGQVAFNVNFAPHSTNEILKQELLSYRGAFRLASDIHLGPGLYLTPSFGISGGHTLESFEFRKRLIFTGLTIVNAANEELSTLRFGSQAGLGLTWLARAWLAFNVSGQVGVVWRRTRLTGHDCVTLVNDLGCGATTVATRRSSISNTRSAVGVRTGISMGVKFIVWGATLHIGGFFNWDSAVPGVNNPSVSQLQAAGTNVGAARVAFSGAWNAGGLIMIRIPLSGAGAHQD